MSTEMRHVDFSIPYGKHSGNHGCREVTLLFLGETMRLNIASIQDLGAAQHSFTPRPTLNKGDTWKATRKVVVGFEEQLFEHFFPS